MAENANLFACLSTASAVDKEITLQICICHVD